MNNIVARLFASSLERAVLETLAYFDVFDFPVRGEELHRYLHGLRASPIDLQNALHALDLAGRIEFRDGYYVLDGRRSLVDRYEATAQQNARRLHLALQYGRLMAQLPFIRMVAVTGSVAMQNGGSGADYDYLLVTEVGRLWLARAFAILLGRSVRLRGHTLCPNIIISERALAWCRHDLYTAHELTQMIPISGFHLYRRLRDLNRWTEVYLPNAQGAPDLTSGDQPVAPAWQALFEPPLRTGLGTGLERFEMHRKIARFHGLPGFGVETVFGADVCQGTFQHHSERTRQAFERRMADLGLASAVPYAMSDSGMESPAVAAHGSDLRPKGTVAGRHSSEAPAIAND